MNLRLYAGWLCVVATAGLYGAMMFGPVAHLRAAAGGLAIFDMRAFGYSRADAVALLTALGEAGRAYYSGVFQTFDLALPLLIGLSLAFLFNHISDERARRGKPNSAIVIMLLNALAAAVTVFDYAENALVARMLATPVDALDETLVRFTSTLTSAKIAAFVIACGMLAGQWDSMRKLPRGTTP